MGSVARSASARSRITSALAQTEFRAFAPDQPDRAAARAKANARVLAESLADRKRAATARAVVATAMRNYWHQIPGGTRRRLREPWSEIPDVASREAQIGADLGEAAARLDVSRAAYVLGSTYAAMLPERYRREHGVFYTPPNLAERLLDLATSAGVDWRRCRALDPACGGGAFLSPMVSRIIDAQGRAAPAAVIEHLQSSVRGYELDSFSAWLSQGFVDAVVLTRLGPEAYQRIDVVDVCDSLERFDSQPEFDLVVGNPPYGRVGLTPRQREAFKRSLFGHANLYGVFLDLGVRWTRPEGVVAFVTPASFLSGEYFKRLRGLLASEAGPTALDFVSARQGVFDNVLQETVLFAGKVGTRTEKVTVSFVDVVSDELRVTSAGAYRLPTDRSQPWMLPRRPELRGVANRIECATTRLQNWGYRVSTGPLVWNRHKPQLRYTKGPNTVPLIWAESVAPEGRFEFRAARRNHAPYFAPGLHDQCLLVREPCVLVQRTTAMEQPRRLIAAELPAAFLTASGGAVTVENHLNMIIPTGEAAAVPPATVAAFLNCPVADAAFRCINGSVAVSAFELEAMPLPSVAAMAQLTRALAEGSDREQLARICETLYDE